jgi:carbon storage regulator
MLVLSRKLNEAIIIDNNIFVRVVRIRGNEVRLRITAPPHISVHRGEVYEAIKQCQIAETLGEDENDGAGNLTLSRRANERIMIGDNIVVTVVLIDSNQIRLGIAAPEKIRIFREEIYIPENC